MTDLLRWIVNNNFRVTRNADFIIVALLEFSVAKRHKKAIVELLGSFPHHLRRGDDLRVRYDFNTHYISEVQQRAVAMAKLLADKEARIDANVREIISAELAIENALKAVRSLKAAVMKRSGKS